MNLDVRDDASSDYGVFGFYLTSLLHLGMCCCCLDFTSNIQDGLWRFALLLHLVLPPRQSSLTLHSPARELECGLPYLERCLSRATHHV